MKVYVVAGSMHEFERWLGKGGTRFEGCRIELLGRARSIKLMAPGSRLVLLAGWMDRADWREVYNAMLATGRRGDR